MPKVTFRNIFDDDTEFTHIDMEYLIPCVYEYARLSSDELYDLIVKNKIILTVNGRSIHPDDWGMFKVVQNDEIIITPCMEGDKFGAVLTIIIGVILLMAAPYLAPYLGPQIGVAAIRLFGVSLILSGFSSLLFTPDVPVSPAIRGGKETQTYNWSGINTVAKVDSPVPVVYGKHMVGGNVISAFTERQGDLNFLYMLLALGEGEISGICTATNYNQVCPTSNPAFVATYCDPAIFIDDQPLSNYDEVNWWYRNGLNASDTTKNEYDPSAQNIIPAFDGARLQQNDGRELTKDGLIYTTTKEVDSAVLQVEAPSLFDASGGSINQTTAKYIVDFRQSGTSTWYPVTADTWSSSVVASTTAIADRVTLSYVYSSNMFGSLGAISPPEWDITVTRISDFWGNSQSVIEIPTGHEEAIITVHMQGINKRNNVIITSSSRMELRKFHMNYGNPWDEKGWFLGPTEVTSVSSIVFGEYSVTPKITIKSGDKFTLRSTKTGSTREISVTGKTKTGIWSSVAVDFNKITSGSGKDVYDVRLTRVDSGKSDNINVQNNLVLESVTEVVDGKFIYPNTALLGFRIKASGQLSGAPPNVVTLVKGVKIPVPDLSGSELFDDCYWSADNSRWEYNASVRTWDNTTYVSEWSNNSMLCVRDLVTNSRYGLGAYITSADLYNTGIITNIKQCHRQYQPTDSDKFDWWNNGDKYTFDKNTRAGVEGTVDSDSREITFSAKSGFHLRVYMTTPLNVQESYRLTYTLASLAASVQIGWFGLNKNKNFPSQRIAADSNDIGNGSHFIDFNPKRSGIDGIGFNMSRTWRHTANGQNKLLSGKITDVSLVRTNDAQMNYHSWDGVIESGQSALVTLLEMCDSFRTWPVWVNGQFNFVTDTDDTPIHTLSRGNTTSFTQSFLPLSDIPSRIIGQFTDEDRKYELRSLAARSSDSTLIKSSEMTIGLKGITNRKKAERELKWKLNKITNSTHSVNVKCGLDYIHATAGDIISIQDDLPQWGYGGRLLSWNSTNAYVNMSASFPVSDVTATYVVRYQTNSNSFVNATVDLTGVINGDKIQTANLLSWPATPCQDSVFIFGKSGSNSKKFRIISAIRTEEDEAELVCVEHLSSLYTDEPTITVIEDNYSLLPNPFAKPGPPENATVSQINVTEGIGFTLFAQSQAGDTNVTGITVQMKQNDDNVISYETIGTIPTEKRWIKYIDNNLELDKTYTFRFTCVTNHKSSDPVDVSFYLPKENYIIAPPTGLRVKYSSPNTQYFEGKEVSIEWNPVESNILAGYSIEVYHSSVTKANLLRTTFVRNETFTYSLDNCLEDSGGVIYGTQANKFLFTVSCVSLKGGISSSTLPFEVYNTVPKNVTGVNAEPSVGGVRFYWHKSTEKDHKTYEYRFRAGADAWSTATRLEDNTLFKSLNATNITSYGRRATIELGIKDVDWYEQKSAAFATNSASANTISDNIFQIFAAKSAGAGFAASLYDGVLTSGGVTIT